MQLLGILVDSGKRFAAIADMNVGDMNQAMPYWDNCCFIRAWHKSYECHTQKITSCPKN